MFNEIEKTGKNLSNAISDAMNVKCQTEYLLRMLYARAKAGGYNGFAHYFNHERCIVTDEICRIIDETISYDEELYFAHIPEIPTEGNKLSDLIEILLNKSNANISAIENSIDSINDDLVSKVICRDLLCCMAKTEVRRSKTLYKLKKTLDKVSNDYGTIMIIDEKLRGV